MLESRNRAGLATGFMEKMEANKTMAQSTAMILFAQTSENNLPPRGPLCLAGRGIDGDGQNQAKPNSDQPLFPFRPVPNIFRSERRKQLWYPGMQGRFWGDQESKLQ